MLTRIPLALAIALTTRSVRAEGFDVSPFRLAVDRGGLGTVEGTTAPEAWTLDAAAASDLALRPLVLHSPAGKTSDVLAARWSVDPALTLGLGGAFAVHMRVPIVLHDEAGTGALPPGVRVDGTGPRSTSLGALVPIAGVGREGRLALRSEGFLSFGQAASLRGGTLFEGRIGLVYTSVLGPTRFSASAGTELAPTSTLGDVKRGSAVRVAAAARYPRDTTFGGVLSIENRTDVSDGVAPSGLIVGGLSAALEHANLQAVGGFGLGDAAGTPRVWLGISWQGAIVRRGQGAAAAPEVSSPPRRETQREAVAPPLAEVASSTREPPLAEVASSTREPHLAALVPVQTPALERSKLIAIAIPPILFETGSAALDRDAVVGLSRLAANVVAAGVHIQLRITGHADQRPFAASNHALGLARARAVGELLVDLGVPAAWIEVASEGAMTPARGTESTEGDRLRDRRVEIIMSAVPTSDASQEVTRAP